MNNSDIAISRVTKILAEGMYEGNMHQCLLAAGNLAGGFSAGGELNSAEVEHLKSLAASKSITPGKGARTFMQGVENGRTSPIEVGYEEVDLSTARAYSFDEPLTLKQRKRDRDVLGTGAIQIDQKKEQVVQVVDTSWIQAADIPPPPTAPGWQAEDFKRYLSLVFKPNELVGLCINVWEQSTKDGSRFQPDAGMWHRTAKELAEAVDKKKGDLGAVMGDHNIEAGAWVRINPLDGNGAKDVNVTDFRHTLIEGDGDDLGKQLQIIRELQLPCSCIVHSGKKSIHALVRVNARTLEEYKERVTYLHEVANANGLKADPACKNPSRLSRLPGYERAGKQQYIIDGRCGLPEWDDWKEWLEDKKDDLPDFEALDSYDFDNLPPKKEEIIQNILRLGHKMLIAGPSKAGKSIDLLELAAAIASGGSWHDCLCKKGKALYVNLELDKISALYRMKDIFTKKGIPYSERKNIDYWNLRGKNKSLDKLAPKLVRRAMKRGYLIIIIDPIYKVLTGDENNAADMAEFTNLFDTITEKLGCAVVCCHHHSKGAQGSKRSADRSSGSGVFARDPDAIIDMIELNIKPDTRKQLIRVMSSKAMAVAAAANGVDLLEFGEDEMENPESFFMRLVQDYPDHADKWRVARSEAITEATNMSGWRIEATLREFAKPVNRFCWFEYPTHTTDTTGMLADAKAEGEEPAWKVAKDDKKLEKQAAKEKKLREEQEEKDRKENDIEKKEKAESAMLYKAIHDNGGFGVVTKDQIATTLRLSHYKTGALMIKYGISSVKTGKTYALFGTPQL